MTRTSGSIAEIRSVHSISLPSTSKVAFQNVKVLFGSTVNILILFLHSLEINPGITARRVFDLSYPLIEENGKV